MKVEVLTVDQATFKKWSWWSNWVDICIFGYNHRPFLLQMRVSRLNKKRFNVISITGVFYKQVPPETIGNLVQMGSTSEQKRQTYEPVKGQL